MIVDPAFIRDNILSDERFASSHGANPHEAFLGLGMFYYGLAYSHRARCCVCLGSGSGFVPRLMRQAQRDLGLEPSQTTLVDADLPELGYGTTDYFDDKKPTTFRKFYPEIEIRKARSSEASYSFPDGVIDYLHIDADHSYSGALLDLGMYTPKMATGGVITIHDTINRADNLGVWRLIREVRKLSSVWDVVEIKLGMGTALLTRRMSDA